MRRQAEDHPLQPLVSIGALVLIGLACWGLIALFERPLKSCILRDPVSAPGPDGEAWR